MFEKAVFRLTLWYLAVIMFLSMGFSLALYRVSTMELSNLQRRQEVLFQTRIPTMMQPSVTLNLDQFNQDRNSQIDQSEGHIALNLINFNLIILVLGGWLSYLLAKRTLQPIEEALESQKRFTADASHELRTPLTAMKTEIEVMLRDKNLTLEESKELHQSTLEEVDKLQTLASSLLTLAIEPEKHNKLTLENVKLSEIAEKAIEKVQAVAKKQNIELKSEIKEIEFKGDSSRLVELLTILLDNAIKYSQPERQVEISSELHNQHLIIKVKDQGIGIKKQDLEHIFDRFYRSDLSRSKKNVEGYGLGLAIAKKIVETHAGKIGVESEVGLGSTFTIDLPIKG